MKREKRNVINEAKNAKAIDKTEILKKSKIGAAEISEMLKAEEGRKEETGERIEAKEKIGAAEKGEKIKDFESMEAIDKTEILKKSKIGAAEISEMLKAEEGRKEETGERIEDKENGRKNFTELAMSLSWDIISDELAESVNTLGLLLTLADTVNDVINLKIYGDSLTKSDKDYISNLILALRNYIGFTAEKTEFLSDKAFKRWFYLKAEIGKNGCV